MNVRKIVSVALVLTVIAVMASAIVKPAEAKTYYTTLSGHQAVRYNSWDIPSSLRPYISVVEYDLAYDKGKGYGVRLYLTNLGMEQGKDWLWAKYFAWYVRANPEWASGGRSEDSVAKEIQWHSKHGIIVSAIEYYYEDLHPWDKPRYGK